MGFGQFCNLCFIGMEIWVLIVEILIMASLLMIWVFDYFDKIGCYC